MMLEHLGVRREVFLELQEEAVAKAITIHDSIEQTCKFFKSHGLGVTFRLASLTKRFWDLGLDYKTQPTRFIEDAFLERIRFCAMNSVLRDIKYSCRVPMLNSFLLVGVVDEGPAYIHRGYHSEDIYCLEEMHIYGIVT